MALAKAFTTDSLLPVPNAVHKIVEAHFSGTGTLRLEVAVYKDLAASQDGTPRISLLTFVDIPFDRMADVNMHSQAYNGLKALEFYDGATDV